MWRTEKAMALQRPRGEKERNSLESISLGKEVKFVSRRILSTFGTDMSEK